MAGKKQQKGTCYFCGAATTKGYMAQHLAKHYADGEGQPCCLLKIEDESKNYWLFVDVPVTSALSVLDTFLRNVWLECCGHMSAFMPVGFYDGEFAMSKKIGYFEPGTVLQYDYDFGSTTTLYITFVREIYRPKQRSAVRVLARNEPYEFSCCRCGKPAAWIDVETWPNEFYCEKCIAENHLEEDILLPVVNSPRMGVCAYTGEYDRFQYDPRKTGR